MPTRLILIRHGETNWSCQKKYCSFSDIGLNKKGREQAKELSQKLNQETIHKVYSSDSKRAIQFAKLVFKRRAVEKIPEFREMNFGVFEGLTYQEILKQYSEIYQSWIEKPHKVTIPKGESLAIFAQRVRKGLKKLVSSNPNKTIAIFTHAGPIKVILADSLKLGLAKIWEINPGLASINTVEVTDG